MGDKVLGLPHVAALHQVDVAHPCASGAVGRRGVGDDDPLDDLLGAQLHRARVVLAERPRAHLDELGVRIDLTLHILDLLSAQPSAEGLDALTKLAQGSQRNAAVAGPRCSPGVCRSCAAWRMGKA